MKLQTLILSLLFSCFCHSQARIEGTVHDEITGSPLKGTRIYLLVFDSLVFRPERLDSFMLVTYNKDTRYDSVYTRIKMITTDTNGYYLFDSLPEDIYKISAFHRTLEIKPGSWQGESFQELGFLLKNKGSVNHSFTLHVTCEFDSTKQLTHCPICHKKDKLLLIRYGLHIGKEEPGYYYNGLCTPPRCHPTKRCMRCSHEF